MNIIDIIKNLFDWKIVGKFPIKRLWFVWGTDKNGKTRRRRGWQFGSLKIHGPFYPEESLPNDDVQPTKDFPDGYCGRCQSYHPKDQECLMPRR